MVVPTWFHRLAITEGASFLILLLIAMPLKYLAGQPVMVEILGRVHGGLFIAYVLAILILWFRDKWGFGRAFFAGVAAVIPAGPWLLHRKIFDAS